MPRAPQHKGRQDASTMVAPYLKLTRPLDDGQRARLKLIFDRILDEAADCAHTKDMFEPYGIVANFVLANRKIADQIANEEANK